MFDDSSSIDNFIRITYDTVYFFTIEKLTSVSVENISLTIDQNCFDHTLMYTKGKEKMMPLTNRQHTYYRIPFIYFFNLLDPLYSYIYSGRYKKSDYIDILTSKLSPYLVYKHRLDINALNKSIKISFKKSK